MIEQSVCAMFSMPSQRRRWELGHLLVVGAAVLSVGAAVIHFVVSPEHFREYWGFGVFFAIVAWLQLAWGAAIALRPTRLVIVGGAVGNTAVVVIWIVSRTAGIPLGPEPGVAEPAGLIDVVATAFEAVLVAACLAWIAACVRHRVIPEALVRGLLLLATAVVVILTTWALAAPAKEDAGHGGVARPHLEGLIDSQVQPLAEER